MNEPKESSGQPSSSSSSSLYHFYSSHDRSKEPRGIFAGGIPNVNNMNMNMNMNMNNSRHRGDKSDATADLSPSSSTDQDMHSGSSVRPKLGTLNGVLLPTLQTILGVILFLRLPSITAQAGCVHTTLIILICVTSTLITAISLSAIATNGTISAGGPYYVISRTLGLEVGGALGLLYYLGTTMACAMSVLGGVEAVLRSVGDPMEGGGGAQSTADVVGDVLGGMLTDDAHVVGDGFDLARRFLQQEPQAFENENLQEMEITGAVGDLGAVGDPIVNEIAEEVEMQMDYQFENSFLVQVGSHYLSFIVAFLLTIFVSVGFRVVDMASNLFLAIMFLSLFCSILGCILFATGYHLGDLIPWDRLFMDNVWPNYTPDPNTGKYRLSLLSDLILQSVSSKTSASHS